MERQIVEPDPHMTHAHRTLPLKGVRGRNADLTLVKKVLNWEPQVSLEEGLEKTYKWIEKMVEKDRVDKINQEDQIDQIG